MPRSALLHPVHDGGAFMHFADLVGDARVNRIRSVVVVFPASMCAMMPMLRGLAERCLPGHFDCYRGWANALLASAIGACLRVSDGAAAQVAASSSSFASFSCIVCRRRASGVADDPADAEREAAFGFTSTGTC